MTNVYIVVVSFILSVSPEHYCLHKLPFPYILSRIKLLILHVLGAS